MYVKTKDGSVSAYPYEPEALRREHPSVSLPAILTDELLAQYGVFVVHSQNTPTYDPATERVDTSAQPELTNGVWTLVKTVVSLTPEQVEAREQRLKQDNKKKASELLYLSDWTTIPDVSNPAVSNPYLTNPTDFVAYRNTLRAIAVNPPTVVTFPAEPDAIWATT
jgi:hypothetical protein